MQRNRYFKSTFGVSGEFIVAKALDVSATPVDGVAPGGGTVAVTIAATPTAGDVINFVIGGVTYSYVVKAADNTAALLVAAIVAEFNATNNVGLVASVSGTTSATFTFAAPAGTAWNGVTVTGAAGTNAGPTFSAFTGTNYNTAGVDPVDAGPQPDLKGFVANALSNTIGVFWEDTKKAVQHGETNLYANRNRKFMYAWKTAGGTTMLTSGLTAGTREYRKLAYNAGTADVWDMTIGGTLTAGQIIHIKIIDRTALNIPNPNWEYIVVSTGTAATDMTAIAALINGETQEAWFTASASGADLTITSTDNKRQMAVAYQLETVGQPGTNIGTDQSTMSIVHTTASIAEVGTTADVTEFEDYMKYQNGVMKYVQDGITAQEMNNFPTNVDAATQYGYLLVKSKKEEIHKSSAVPAMKNDHFVAIAIANTALNALAGF
jgi:hypothetical protein